jgi:hypothetical protein
MFVDPGNNLLYTAGKGDTNIKFYEISDYFPFINNLSEYKSSQSQAGLAMIPQRLNDVDKCEVANFMKLSGTEISTISFQVPRKNSGKEFTKNEKKIEIFQEDIFPEVFSGKPSFTGKEYLKGNDKLPDLISMKKNEMISIYEVPIDSGGKLKPAETKTFGKGQMEGVLISLNPPKKKENCFVEIKLKEISIQDSSKKSSKKNVNSKLTIPTTAILSVHKCKGMTEDPEDDSLTFQFCTTDRMYYFVAENENERNRWVDTIKKNMKRSYQVIHFF